MPTVHIEIVEGRTVEQKRGLLKDVTEALVKNIQCNPAGVRIVITDLKRENTGDGGVLLSDKK